MSKEKSDRRGMLTTLVVSTGITVVGLVVENAINSGGGGTSDREPDGEEVPITTLYADSHTNKSEWNSISNTTGQDNETAKGYAGDEYTELVLDADTGGVGQLKMSATGLCRAGWRAEESGRHKVTVVYDGDGSYNFTEVGSASPRSTVVSVLAVSRVGEQGGIKAKTTSQTYISNAPGPVLNERIVEAIKAAISAFAFKKSGKLVGMVTKEATDAVDAYFDISSSGGPSDSFNTAATNHREISLSFDALAGDRFVFDLFTVVSLGVKAKSQTTFDIGAEATIKPDEFVVEKP